MESPVSAPAAEKPHNPVLLRNFTAFYQEFAPRAKPTLDADSFLGTLEDFFEEFHDNGWSEGAEFKFIAAADWNAFEESHTINLEDGRKTFVISPASINALAFAFALHDQDMFRQHVNAWLRVMASEHKDVFRINCPHDDEATSSAGTSSVAATKIELYVGSQVEELARYFLNKLSFQDKRRLSAWAATLPAVIFEDYEADWRADNGMRANYDQDLYSFWWHSAKHVETMMDAFETLRKIARCEESGDEVAVTAPLRLLGRLLVEEVGPLGAAPTADLDLLAAVMCQRVAKGAPCMGATTLLVGAGAGAGAGCCVSLDTWRGICSGRLAAPSLVHGACVDVNAAGQGMLGGCRVPAVLAAAYLPLANVGQYMHVHRIEWPFASGQRRPCKRRAPFAYLFAAAERFVDTVVLAHDAKVQRQMRAVLVMWAARALEPLHQPFSTLVQSLASSEAEVHALADAVALLRLSARDGSACFVSSLKQWWPGLAALASAKMLCAAGGGTLPAMKASHRPQPPMDEQLKTDVRQYLNYYSIYDGFQLRSLDAKTLTLLFSKYILGVAKQPCDKIKLIMEAMKKNKVLSRKNYKDLLDIFKMSYYTSDNKLHRCIKIIDDLFDASTETSNEESDVYSVCQSVIAAINKISQQNRQYYQILHGYMNIEPAKRALAFDGESESQPALTGFDDYMQQRMEKDVILGVHVRQDADGADADGADDLLVVNKSKPFTVVVDFIQNSGSAHKALTISLHSSKERYENHEYEHNLKDTAVVNATITITSVDDTTVTSEPFQLSDPGRYVIKVTMNGAEEHNKQIVIR